MSDKKREDSFDLNMPERPRKLLEELFKKDDWSWYGLAEFLRRNTAESDAADLIEQLGGIRREQCEEWHSE